MELFKIPLHRKTFVLAALVLLALFGALQLVRPALPHPPVTGDYNGPSEVKAILERACYDCHSNQTHLRWYDKIQPIYWQVARHVKSGREGLNFSEWNKLSAGDQKSKLWEAVNQILAGAMPLQSYEMVHPTARITPADLSVLKTYLTSQVQPPAADTSNRKAATHSTPLSQLNQPMDASLPKTVNGITYIPDYKNWQIISTTERNDNGTLRVVFGNPTAVQAVKEHHINPWPNGTIFAKVAWDQQEGADGITRSGAFKQVEYMIKDDKAYAATRGWGWARFKTPQLVPYGKNVLFTGECIRCHQPMKNNDFVFTLPIQN